MGPFKTLKVPPVPAPPTEFALGYDMIEAPKPESYCRLSRKDFWNDPERWDGIDDPRKTMIWEVRRPDRIEVAATKPFAEQFDPRSAEYQRAMLQQANAQCQMQYAQYQNQLQAASLLNAHRPARSLLWPIL